MSKGWSSFEGQQLLQENWRNFLAEKSETATWLADQGYDTEDHWEEPEEQEGAPQASNYPDVSTGLDSEYKQDSLKQVLSRLTPPLDPRRIQALINVIAQIAGDEGIMLELSLKGLNSEQDRIIDSAETAQILNTIAGWNLPAKENTALIKALNYWGRVNSVKFTAPPAAAPAVANTTDPSDDVSQDTTTPDEPEPEPTVASKNQQKRTPRIGKQTQGYDPTDPGDTWLPSPTEPELEPEPLINLNFDDIEDPDELASGAPFPDLEPLEPREDDDPGPGRPPEGYDKGSNDIFHSMIPYPGDHGWDMIVDDTWALYKDLNTPRGETVPESGLFAWSPSSKDYPHGVWIRSDIDPQELTNLPIKENLLERWQTIAGINKRVL